MTVWRIYDVPFQDLLDALEQSREEITGGANAVLFNPPYKIRRIVEFGCSAFTQLSLKAFIARFNRLSVSMKLGAHGHIHFCNTVQVLVRAVERKDRRYGENLSERRIC